MAIETHKEQFVEKMRIIQELVPGKQVTLAHIIASPDEALYQKLGMTSSMDVRQAAIGILSLTPGEIAVIAADLALKSSNVALEFIDRTAGTLIFTGLVADVDAALTSILSYLEHKLQFTICPLTKT